MSVPDGGHIAAKPFATSLAPLSKGNRSQSFCANIEAINHTAHKFSRFQSILVLSRCASWSSPSSYTTPSFPTSHTLPPKEHASSSNRFCNPQTCPSRSSFAPSPAGARDGRCPRRPVRYSLLSHQTSSLTLLNPSQLCPSSQRSRSRPSRSTVRISRTGRRPSE